MNCPKCLADNPPDTLFCGKCGAKFEVGASRVKPKGPGGTKFDSKPRPLSVTRTIETTPDGLGKGELFAGRFELIEELGAGGMGIVYRAYDKQVGEEIALKILHPEIALDDRTVDRFRNEIKLARRISHRNVCRMHELHEDGKQLFITMEYVSGQDLKGLIKEEGALTTGKALSIAKQVAEGLCEAHNLGVIHRDLKPQNIMVDKEGTAKIMDFGIARSLRAAGMTAEGMIIGTPEYMAPEQVEGLEADQRTDIYAMGAILFEMVTGRVPFEGDSALSVAYKHKNEPPPPPRKLNANIPEPFNKLILRCLEKEKDNRYQTAEELLADLIRIEEGLPISERVALPARSTIRIAREKPTGVKRFLIPALGILVLALASIIALRVLPRKPTLGPDSASGKPSIAVLYFENLSGDPALGYLKTGLTKLLSIGLQESKLVRVLDENSTYGILKKHKLDETSKYTREDLVKIAEEGGVSYTASGSLMKAGENIIIMLTLQNPSAGEVAAPIKLTCQNEADIYSKADELVARIKSGMNLTPAQLAADAGRGIQQITTSSPEALKYYLESYERFRLLDYAKTRGLLEKAIELDPNFAMALIGLAVSYEGAGNYSKGRELRKRAFELRDRLPEADRFKVEANYYLTLPGEESRLKAFEAYQKYFEYVPRDAGELLSLGILYENNGDYAKSLECHLRAYESDPSPLFLIGVMCGLQHTGQLAKAEETLKDFQKSHQGNTLVQWNATFFYINRRKFDQALAEIERGFLLDPSPDWSWDCVRGDVYLARGDLAEAEKEYLRVIAKAEKPDYIINAKGGLIALYILQGKTKRAAAEDLSEALAWHKAGGSSYTLINAYLRLKNFNKASEYIEKYLSRFRELKDPPGYRKGLWWKGIAAVEKHDLGEAEKVAEELKSSAQKSPYKNEMQRVEHLQGLIDLEKGEYAEAIDNLKKASSWVPFEVLWGYMETQALHYYPLAFAYFKAGDLPKARAEFERVTTLMGGKFSFGDLYAKSFYWLGKIAEAQKDKRRAAENYGKFLDLWKDADPGQPEVDDAKARLAAL